MIDFVFTLDYEIYGDGTGTLKDLVYEPGERLRKIFQKWDARFVAFVEAAEFERIEACGTDTAIDLVKGQIRDFHHDGFEIGLHLHPQWFNASYEQGRWLLDYSEYNLCTLPRTRIAEVVDQSLAYLRRVLNHPQFTPLSFRAGNWLFQPTPTASSELAQRGIRLDSSVFKGGLLHNHGLDYRRALKNGYYWTFTGDVNAPDPAGSSTEVPIHTEMVPIWKMPTSKRMGFSKGLGMSGHGARYKFNRARDLLRFRYPLKLDFCRMTLDELTSMMGGLIREDREDPASYRPIVAIGHTKDLTDAQTVDAFLAYLRGNGVGVATFQDIYPKLQPGSSRAEVGDAKCEPPVINTVTTSADGSVENAASLRYVLITPARNEADLIENTIRSVIAQTVRPLRWVIVSDGSTDGTDDIVRKYAADHSWIELVRMPERKERHFAGKAHAFNAGQARVKDLDYDVIGNLDADITFDDAYFNFLLLKFEENPQLGVGGTPFREASFQYDLRFTSIEHVSGACQLFRRECFEEIGGYLPLKNGGVDLTAVITARMKGWQTRSFPEKVCNHHRKQGSANRTNLAAHIFDGRVDYMLGCDPIWQVTRCIYRLVCRRPFALSGGYCLAGYLWAMLTRQKQVHSPEFIRFRRAEERARLRALLARAMPWGYGTASKQQS